MPRGWREGRVASFSHLDELELSRSRSEEEITPEDAGRREEGVIALVLPRDLPIPQLHRGDLARLDGRVEHRALDREARDGALSDPELPERLARARIQGQDLPARGRDDEILGVPVEHAHDLRSERSRPPDAARGDLDAVHLAVLGTREDVRPVRDGV